jgi:hypothetical protein
MSDPTMTPGQSVYDAMCSCDGGLISTDAIADARGWTPPPHRIADTPPPNNRRVLVHYGLAGWHIVHGGRVLAQMPPGALPPIYWAPLPTPPAEGDT